MSLKSDNSGLFVTFINPHAYFLVRKNPHYLNMIRQFDMVLPDGVAVAKAAQHFLKEPAQRVSFDTTSLAFPVFQWAVDHKKSIAFVGGISGVTDLAAKKIKEKFPELNIILTLDGFTDKEILAQKIIDQSADIVVCGMGAPHQEALLLMLKEKKWCGIGFTCGGYFDQLDQGVDYYPQWVDRLNIRFLYRLCKEPKRLWRRYLVEYRVFIGHCIKNIFIKSR